MNKKIEYKEVFTTFNIYDISFIKSLYDANDIRYFIEGENFLKVYPVIEPAMIKVDARQLESAKELLKDFKSSHFKDLG